MNIVHRDVKVSIEINCHARLAEIDCKAVAYFYEPNKTYYVGLLNQLEKRGNPPGFAGLAWFQPKYKVINSISFIYCILIFFLCQGAPFYRVCVQLSQPVELNTHAIHSGLSLHSLLL